MNPFTKYLHDSNTNLNNTAISHRRHQNLPCQHVHLAIDDAVPCFSFVYSTTKGHRVADGLVE